MLEPSELMFRAGFLFLEEHEQLRQIVSSTCTAQTPSVIVQPHPLLLLYAAAGRALPPSNHRADKSSSHKSLRAMLSITIGIRNTFYWVERQGENQQSTLVAHTLDGFEVCKLSFAEFTLAIARDTLRSPSCWNCIAISQLCETAHSQVR